MTTESVHKARLKKAKGFVFCYECKKHDDMWCNKYKRATCQGAHQQMYCGCVSGERKDKR